MRRENGMVYLTGEELLATIREGRENARKRERRFIVVWAAFMAVYLAAYFFCFHWDVSS